MACCNMAAAEGIDLEAAMERCVERQARRGRYEKTETTPKMRYCPWCGAEVSYEG